MANNVVYDAEGNASRHLQMTPLPEPNILAVPDDDEPMAMRVGQGHAPAAQLGVALQTPQTLNPPVPAFGLELTPSSQGTNDDGVVLQSLGALSLNDQFVGDKEDDVDANPLIKSTEDAGEHTAEEDPTFVPFICGQLDCSKCHPVREVVHESANHKLFFVVHAADAGEFQHAITDHKYIGADGQTILNELMYLDLRQHTHEWVQNFIACSVERLRNDSTGKLEDSWSTFYAMVPPPNSNTHMELKMDKPPAKGKAVVLEAAPDAPQLTEANMKADHHTFNAANWPGLSPDMMYFPQVSAETGGSSAAGAAGGQTLAAKQRQRNPMLSMLHMSKKNVAKELNISPTSLDRLCHKSGTISAHRINSLNNKIKKLEQTSQRTTAAAIVQLKIKKQLDALKFVKARLYACIKSLLENEKHNDGAGTSGSKADDY